MRIEGSATAQSPPHAIGLVARRFPPTVHKVGRQMCYAELDSAARSHVPLCRTSIGKQFCPADNRFFKSEER